MWQRSRGRCGEVWRRGRRRWLRCGVGIGGLGRAIGSFGTPYWKGKEFLHRVREDHRAGSSCYERTLCRIDSQGLGFIYIGSVTDMNVYAAKKMLQRLTA